MGYFWAAVMYSQEIVFSSVTKSETVEMNPDFLRSDGWRKIVTQVESALCREDRSRQALDQLQQLAAEQGASTQFLLKSVIRETIRLTLECFGEAADLFKRGEAAAPVAAPVAVVPTEIKPVKPVALVLTPEQKEAQEDAAVFTAMSRVLQNAKPDKSLRDRLRPTNPKLSPIEIAEQAAQVREASLTALCNEFRQHRSQLNLSLKQIHSTTFIPLHHLQSLEENKLDRLPEDVYLRGFLRQIEKCFNLADGQLSHHLPVVERSQISVPTVAPTRSASPGFGSNHPNYAYIAYAALMAGGVCWIAQQGSPKSNLPSIKIDTPVSGPQNAPQKTSSQQVQQTQAKLAQNISQPEAFV
jgi:cytoskeleton protein RodZ